MKMKISLCLYSDEKFEIPRKALVNLANSCNLFSKVFEYDRSWLESTEFYLENKEIFLIDDNEYDYERVINGELMTKTILASK